MDKNNFKNNDLIIPNGRIEDAFYYKTGMDLHEGYEYTVATKSDMIYYQKYVKSGMVETRDINNYMTEKRKYAGEVCKERDKEIQDMNNMLNTSKMFMR